MEQQAARIKMRGPARRNSVRHPATKLRRVQWGLNLLRDISTIAHKLRMIAMMGKDVAIHHLITTGNYSGIRLEE
jgi:hypothetical protein